MGRDFPDFPVPAGRPAASTETGSARDAPEDPMLKGFTKYIDRWSGSVIVLTVVLFVLALFLHGFTHDLLLEAGVLLVSAKLVIMAHKNSVLGEELHASLDEIKAALRQSQESRSGK